MSYRARPAWRNQWFMILLTIACSPLMAAPLVSLASTFGLSGGPLASAANWAMALISPVLLLVVLYRHYEWDFVVENGVIESRRGIIGRDVQSIRLKDLRNVNVRQSFFQRIFFVGDVEFSSSGGSGIEVVFHGVPSPMEVKTLVHSLESGG
ncbi:MAG TPA: PH domain-containing protein [Gammaproteobacteria bacterium]